jgi:hypothetical protein
MTDYDDRITRNVLMKTAVKVLARTRKMYEAHDEDVARWYRSEDGKYRYPTCIHGTSTWTDYDNICGACEDGYTYFDYARDGAEAIAEARNRWARFWELYDMALRLRELGYTDWEGILEHGRQYIDL